MSDGRAADHLGNVRAGRIAPATTKARRLPKAAKRIRVSWRRAGWLPSGTRLGLYAATSSRAPGRLLRSGLRTTGSTTVKVSALRKGANHLYLVPQAEGIRFDLVRFAKPVWKR